jgi:hypothetical protein
MFIFGFDCALQNLGVCVVRYDEGWQEKIRQNTDRLNDLYKNIDSFSKEEFISEACNIVKTLDLILKNIIEIIYFNVFDLIPGVKAPGISILNRTSRLKYVLYCLDDLFPNPDIVLVEDQMIHNDIARAMMNQILYHYFPIPTDIVFNHKIKTKQSTKLSGNSNLINVITYGVRNYPIIDINRIDGASNGLTADDNYIGNNHIGNNPTTVNRVVECVGTTLKNSCRFHSDGAYENFIERYTNYTANKKHTDWNFKYFIEKMDCKNRGDLLMIANKTNDIADAFMMVFGWLRKRDMI